MSAQEFAYITFITALVGAASCSLLTVMLAHFIHFVTTKIDVWLMNDRRWEKNALLFALLFFGWFILCTYLLLAFPNEVS